MKIQELKHGGEEVSKPEELISSKWEQQRESVGRGEIRKWEKAVRSKRLG